MSRPIVLDASVAVPLVHGEDESDHWRRAAAGWLRANRRVIVPDHFWLEVSNTLFRRHRFRGEAVLEALHALDDVVADTVTLDRPILVLAIDRAERFDLTLYDAAYLAVAESLDADLATMDHELGRAAGPRRMPGPQASRRLSESEAAYESPKRVTWPDYSGAASYLSSMRARIRQAGGQTEA